MKKVLVALSLIFAVGSVNLYAHEGCSSKKDKKECSKKSEKECADAKAKGCAEGSKETKSCCSKKSATEKKD